MNVLRIAGCTRVLAKDQKEYFSLPIRDNVAKLDGGHIIPFMSSCWEPSPQEAAMIDSASIRATVCLDLLGADGQFVTAFWNLQSEERADIGLGGSLIISISGTIHPPVRLYLSDHVENAGRAAMAIGGRIVALGIQKAPALEAV